jgi:hypothetical protein
MTPLLSSSASEWHPERSTKKKTTSPLFNPSSKNPHGPNAEYHSGRALSLLTISHHQDRALDVFPFP